MDVDHAKANHPHAGPATAAGERFSLSSFLAGGLTHVGKEHTATLRNLCVSTAQHHHEPEHVRKARAEAARKKKKGHTLHKHHHHKHHKHHHHHHHTHHHDRRASGDDANDNVAEEVAPLDDEERAEFDAIGQHVDFMKKLHPRMREMLYDRFHHIRVKEGHLVIMQGDPSDAWYILLRGSLQCVISQNQSADEVISAKTKAPKKKAQYQFDKNAAEQSAIDNSEGGLALNLSESKRKAPKEQVGHLVHYYFGHGHHVAGLVVGVFTPGDAFGESAFTYAEELVEHRIRGHAKGLEQRRASFMVSDLTTKKRLRMASDNAAAAADNDFADSESEAKADAEFDATCTRVERAAGAAREAQQLEVKRMRVRHGRSASMGAISQSKSSIAPAKPKAAPAGNDAKGGGDVGSGNTSPRPSPPPAPELAKRAASVVALEESDLLRVSIKDYVECHAKFRQWVIDQICDTLRPLPQFDDLTDIELEHLSKHAKLRTLGRNCVLSKIGQALSCYVLKEGTLRVLVKQPCTGKRAGKFLEIATLCPGNTIGGSRLAQGCMRGGDGFCIVTGGQTTQNEIIEIEPEWFFRFVIRSGADTTGGRRERWAEAAKGFPAMNRFFKVEKRQHGQNLHHFESTPCPTPKLRGDSRKQHVWNRFKRSLVSRVVQDAAGDSPVPEIFRKRNMGTISSRREKMLTTTSAMAKQLARGTEIQVKGGMLSDYERKMHERTAKAAARFSTLTAEQLAVIANATGIGKAEAAAAAEEAAAAAVAAAAVAAAAAEEAAAASAAVEAARRGARSKIPWWERTVSAKADAGGLASRTTLSVLAPSVVRDSPDVSVWDTLQTSPIREPKSCPPKSTRRRLGRASPLTRRDLRRIRGEDTRGGSLLSASTTTWIPTRRVVEEQSTVEYIGRKYTRTGRWHLFQDSAED